MNTRVAGGFHGGQKRGAAMGMLADRLRKNLRHLRKWARRNGVTCFRAYDRDIPEHPVVVDLYEGPAVVWALMRTRDDTPEQREAWLREVETEVREGTGAVEVFLKERRPGGQYRREGDRGVEKVVHEGGLRFLVNLSDYHDTGLFLDHRLTRAMVREQARGKRVLNLFCYTGSFTVYALDGGARETASVDLSNTWLDQAARNVELNGFPPQEMVRADVLAWLAEAPGRYDLVVCDPPTFSNSKRMQGAFDVGRQHPDLINGCLRLLEPGGTLYFSTNDRGFELRPEAIAPCRIEEISRQTIPEDYRDKRIHRCFRIQGTPPLRRGEEED